MAKYSEKTVSYEDLLLDPNNYRFQDNPGFVYADESRYAEATVQTRAARGLRDTTLLQLKKSIVRNGLLPFEKLIVRPYPKDKKDKYVVLEGNRRLAAIRWIVEDFEAGVKVSKTLIKSFNQIPVFVLQADKSDPVFQDAILGVRHVSGIKEWGGYQRAKLVVELMDKHNLETTDVSERLGMSASEVNRRYRAFKSLEQMKADEEFGEFATADMYPIFHEAVSLPKVREWLEWDENEATFANESELEKFYALVTPHDEDGEKVEPKLRTYADVRDLRSILENEEALTILHDPDRSLSDSLAVAKAPQLRRAWARHVASAIDALENIPVPELKKFKKEDLDELQKLGEAVAEVLSNFKKLTKK
jgi:hypothetical protein